VEAFFEKKLKCHVVKRTPAQENASTEKGEEEESVEAKKSQRKEASDKQAEVQPFVHTVFIRIVSSSVTVSINAASEMYKRNISPKWVSEAPLRETLAAAIVRTATEQVLAEIKPKRRKDPIEYTHTIWGTVFLNYCPFGLCVFIYSLVQTRFVEQARFSLRLLDNKHFVEQTASS
jgi:hypothetical protein